MFYKLILVLLALACARGVERNPDAGSPQPCPEDAQCTLQMPGVDQLGKQLKNLASVSMKSNALIVFLKF